MYNLKTFLQSVVYRVHYSKTRNGSFGNNAFQAIDFSQLLDTFHHHPHIIIATSSKYDWISSMAFGNARHYFEFVLQ